MPGVESFEDNNEKPEERNPAGGIADFLREVNRPGRTSESPGGGPTHADGAAPERPGNADANVGGGRLPPSSDVGANRDTSAPGNRPGVADVPSGPGNRPGETDVLRGPGSRPAGGNGDVSGPSETPRPSGARPAEAVTTLDQGSDAARPIRDGAPSAPGPGGASPARAEHERVANAPIQPSPEVRQAINDAVRGVGLDGQSNPGRPADGHTDGRRTNPEPPPSRLPESPTPVDRPPVQRDPVPVSDTPRRANDSPSVPVAEPRGPQAEHRSGPQDNRSVSSPQPSRDGPPVQRDGAPRDVSRPQTNREDAPREVSRPQPGREGAPREIPRPQANRDGAPVQRDDVRPHAQREAPPGQRDGARTPHEAPREPNPARDGSRQNNAPQADRRPAVGESGSRGGEHASPDGRRLDRQPERQPERQADRQMREAPLTLPVQLRGDGQQRKIDPAEKPGSAPPGQRPDAQGLRSQPRDFAQGPGSPSRNEAQLQKPGSGDAPRTGQVRPEAGDTGRKLPPGSTQEERDLRGQGRGDASVKPGTAPGSAGRSEGPTGKLGDATGKGDAVPGKPGKVDDPRGGKGIDIPGVLPPGMPGIELGGKGKGAKGDATTTDRGGPLDRQPGSAGGSDIRVPGKDALAGRGDKGTEIGGKPGDGPFRGEIGGGKTGDSPGRSFSDAIKHLLGGKEGADQPGRTGMDGTKSSGGIRDGLDTGGRPGTDGGKVGIPGKDAVFPDGKGGRGIDSGGVVPPALPGLEISFGGKGSKGDSSTPGKADVSEAGRAPGRAPSPADVPPTGGKAMGDAAPAPGGKTMGDAAPGAGGKTMGDGAPAPGGKAMGDGAPAGKGKQEPAPEGRGDRGPFIPVSIPSGYGLDQSGRGAGNQPADRGPRIEPPKTEMPVEPTRRVQDVTSEDAPEASESGDSDTRAIKETDQADALLEFVKANKALLTQALLTGGKDNQLLAQFAQMIEGMDAGAQAAGEAQEHVEAAAEGPEEFVTRDGIIIRRAKDTVPRRYALAGNEERQTYIVQAGDTLESIADHFFLDERLAMLILDINRASLSAGYVDDRYVVDLQAGVAIYLPTEEEVDDFYSQTAGGSPGGSAGDAEAELAAWEHSLGSAGSGINPYASGQDEEVKGFLENMERTVQDQNPRDQACLRETGEIASLAKQERTPAEDEKEQSEPVSLVDWWWD